MVEQFTNLTALFVEQEIKTVLSSHFDRDFSQNENLMQAVLSFVLNRVSSIYNTTEAQQSNPINVEFLHFIVGIDATIVELIYEGIQHFLDSLDNKEHYKPYEVIV